MEPSARIILRNIVSQRLRAKLDGLFPADALLADVADELADDIVDDLLNDERVSIDAATGHRPDPYTHFS